MSTDISVSNLSSEETCKETRKETVAICVHGGELMLSHIWGSVKVMVKFDETEVQFYEAERLVHFIFCIKQFDHELGISIARSFLSQDS